MRPGSCRNTRLRNLLTLTWCLIIALVCLRPAGTKGPSGGTRPVEPWKVGTLSNLARFTDKV